MAEAELAHPVKGRPGATEKEWLKALNARFTDLGLLPVTLDDRTEHSYFDRLTTDVPDHMMVDDPDAPLVTVIMSTFEPDESFRTAVSSLVAQTWRNLEILVVDDCSPPEYDELLESVTSMDPRIRLIRMPVNGGTYKIRNHAIAQMPGCVHHVPGLRRLGPPRAHRAAGRAAARAHRAGRHPRPIGPRAR